MDSPSSPQADPRQTPSRHRADTGQTPSSPKAAPKQTPGRPHTSAILPPASGSPTEAGKQPPCRPRADPEQLIGQLGWSSKNTHPGTRCCSARQTIQRGTNAEQQGKQPGSPEAYLAIASAYVSRWKGGCTSTPTTCKKAKGVCFVSPNAAWPPGPRRVGGSRGGGCSVGFSGCRWCAAPLLWDPTHMPARTARPSSAPSAP